MTPEEKSEMRSLRSIVGRLRTDLAASQRRTERMTDAVLALCAHCDGYRHSNKGRLRMLVARVREVLP